LKNITISPCSTIREAMKALDNTAEKCLLIVDAEDKLLGSLTDGDIRRAILTGAPFSDDISAVYFNKPDSLLLNSYTNEEAKKILREKKLPLLPVLDQDGYVVDYVTWQKLGIEEPKSNSLCTVPVVIMAGGRGTRLKPFTDILPKPLMPIKEKTIIEHIIDQFTNFGCQDFYISVNYKSKIIKAYFEELEPSYNVTFIEEEVPLGTVGSLSLLADKLQSPFFVTNCDILVKTDFEKLLTHHTSGGFQMSLVASAKDYIIPYGTCDLAADGSLDQINEKPNYEFLVNTGLYILNPQVLSLIPEDKVFHATCLMDAIKASGANVGVFPVNESSWIDIGQWGEYNSSFDKIL
jgi:dTDP-glucose pyrophosphorylase